jgi:hypothetical protein
MKSLQNLKRLSVVILIVSVVGISAVLAYADYRFKVKNSTDSKIVKLLASPDGKKYGQFDIGSGIKPGGVMELVWDKSTDNSNCEWYFKAKFADGSESEPVEFDFCEKGLVLEFTD